MNISQQFDSLTERQQSIIQRTKTLSVLDEDLRNVEDIKYQLYWTRNLLKQSVWKSAFVEVTNQGLYEYPEQDNFIYNGYSYKVSTSESRYSILYVTRDLI